MTFRKAVFSMCAVMVASLIGAVSFAQQEAKPTKEAPKKSEKQESAKQAESPKKEITAKKDEKKEEVKKAAKKSGPALGSDAGIEAKVSELLKQMTLEEKIGQMTQVDSAAIKDKGDVAKYFLGSVLSGGESDPKDNSPFEWTKSVREFEEAALKTRLKIPLLYGIDAVHGHNNVEGATIFPHNIGLGATRNAELVEKAARCVANEVKVTGIQWSFAPCLAVALDERWGRTYESFGESPELAKSLGEAYVRGLQGKFIDGPGSVVACAKHYMGDGGTTGGVDQGDTKCDEATLRKIHLPGYEAAVKANVGTIMVSYSSWNGEKMHGQKHLLTDVLKGELAFKGFLVSDWAAIDQLSPDFKACIEKSINAGIDMAMIPNGPDKKNNYVEFISDLKALVEADKVPMSRIDDAVTRILRVKYAFGTFHHPITAPVPDKKITPEELAEEAAKDDEKAVEKKVDVLVAKKPEAETAKKEAPKSEKPAAIPATTMKPVAKKLDSPTAKEMKPDAKAEEKKIDKIEVKTDAKKDAAVAKADEELAEKPKEPKFSDPGKTALYALRTIGAGENRKVARECVHQSVVLLKNEKNTLPLSKQLKKVYVVGKAGDDLGIQCGGWTITWQGKPGDAIKNGTTIYGAVRNAVSSSTLVIYSPDGNDLEGAEAVVVVVGEQPYAEMKGDRKDLTLSKADVALIRKAKAAGVPTTVVLLSGRPLIINEALESCDAFVAAWLPGTEGQGVGDVLFGDYKPTGKLPCTWPKSMDQIPINVGDKNAEKALFPYGFGLSYK